MADTDKSPTKEEKKAAKAAVKLAKKQPPAATGPAAADGTPATGGSPAERAARAAEQKVYLERWRTVLAAASVIVALATLWFLYFRNA